MLQDSFARFEYQVQAVERAVMLLKFIDYAQALHIMFEAAAVLHARIQCFLPGMPERRMTEIVRQRNRFDQILVQAQVPRNRSCDLRHFDAVRQASAKQIAFMIDEHLRFVFKTSECGRMNNTVTITLKFSA